MYIVPKGKGAKFMEMNRKTIKLIKEVKEFLKEHPFVWEDDKVLKGYKSVNGKQISDKIDEFLKSIDFKGDQYDYEWKYKINFC